MAGSTKDMALGEKVAVLAALLRELALSQSLLSPLLAHAHAVQAAADRLGLVSHRDIDGIVARHTADSLLFAIAREPQADEAWVDVGSGAGFPGLVLALCYPETAFTLLEPQRRRAGFLELQVTELGLGNAAVLQERAADLSTEFDVATARALAEPLLALEALKGLVSEQGAVLLAVGQSAIAPMGAEDLDVRRPGVDSPGRLFMIASELGGA
jgi:16S rRNA (guanine527-N7)-methyltransferase